MSCSDNYRQLQLLRGVRAVEETEEDRAERDMTRSEAKVELEISLVRRSPQLCDCRCGTEQVALRLCSRSRRQLTWLAPGSSSH